MGWVDSTWAPSIDLITSQINTLPSAVASQLAFDKVKVCGTPKVQAFLSDPALSQCTQSFTAAQKTAWENLVTDVIMYQCLNNMMETACTGYIKSRFPILGFFLG
jgi:cellulase/cellobiase CelA1